MLFPPSSPARGGHGDIFWLRMKMLLPVAVPGAAAHKQPTRDFAAALGTDPVCPDCCVITWYRCIAGRAHLHQSSWDMAGRVWSCPLISPCWLQEWGSPGAHRTLVCPVPCVPCALCAHGARTALHVAACSRSWPHRAADCPRAVCSSVCSGLNPSPSVHVTRAGTPWC